MFEKLAGAGILLFLAAVTWVILDTINTDAIAMGLGVILGIVAGLPVALLILAAQRNRPQDPPPPPVVILGAQQRGELPTSSPGERPDRWIEGPGRRYYIEEGEHARNDRYE